MAALTDQLATPSGSSRVLSGPGSGAAGAGFVASLSGLASGLTQAFDAQGDRAFKNEQRAAWREDRATDEQTRGALDEAAGIGFNSMYQASQPSTDDILANTDIDPQTMQIVTSNLDKTRKAVSQGRLPSGTLDLQLETQINDLFAKYPDARAEISTFLKSQGYDSLMFRDIKNQFAIEQSQIATEIDVAEASIKYAGDKGAIVPGMTREQMIETGARLQANDAAYKQQMDAIEALKKGRELDRDEFKFQQAQQDRITVSTVKADLSTKLGPLIQNLTVTMSAAEGDPNRQKRVDELASQANTYFEAYRIKAKASLGPDASPEAFAAIDQEIDTYQKSVTSMFTGPLSQFQESKRALETMKTSLSLQSGEDFRIYSMLSDALGTGVVNQLFANGELALPEATVKALKAEVAGFRVPGSEAVSINDMVQVLRGTTGLQDYDPKKAAQLFPTVVAQSNAAQVAINRDKDFSKIPDYLTAQSNLVDVANVSIQPGTATLSAVANATYQIAGTGALGVTNRTINDPTYGPQTKALVYAQRAQATRFVDIVRNRPDMMTAPNGYQRVEFNNTTGSYEVVFDPKAFQDYLKKTGSKPMSRTEILTGQVQGQITEAEARKKNSELVKTATVLNTNLNFLTETNRYDEDFPKTTPLGARRFFAGVAPLVSADGKTPAKSPDQQFDEAATALSTALKEGPAAMAKPDELSSLDPNDPRWLYMTVFGEATGDASERQAVGAVILNRARATGKTLKEVVMEGNGSQFNVWFSGEKGKKHRDRMLGMKPEDYAALEAQLGPIAKGVVPKELEGLDSFLHPQAMTALGYSTPAWASGGDGRSIGAGQFFAGKYGR